MAKLILLKFFSAIVFYHSRNSACCYLKLNFHSVSPGSKPTQKQLLQQLYNTVPDKWHPIGIYLEIPEGQLNVIGAKYHGDPQKCLMAMLTESWLPRVSPPQHGKKLLKQSSLLAIQMLPKS